MKKSYLFLSLIFVLLNWIASDGPDLEWIEKSTGLSLPETFEVLESEYIIALGEEEAKFENSSGEEDVCFFNFYILVD